MYRLLYDQRTLFDPYGDDDEVVSDASLSMESNASSYLDFTISAKHPLYDVVAEREGVVRLYSDDALLFEGIIESIETDLELNKAIGCISALEYLNDSVVRPYSTVAGEEDLTAPSSVAGYFQWLIDQHNEHVLDTSKQFKIGVNQGSALKDSDYVYYSSSSYPTTASELTTNVIDAYGGYLFLRYENGLKVLDLYADVHDMNAQVVDFGVNITDFTKTVDTKDQCTALVVQGGSPTFVNGDFEDRTNNWEVFPGTEAETGVVHSGTYSSYFTEGYGEYVNSSFFYLKPGWRYKSIAWVKNERSSDVVIRAFYQTENGGSWVNYSCGGTDSLTVPNDGEWHELTVDFLPNGSENAKIRPRWIFDYVSNDGGRVYVDDFDFTRIDGENSIAEDPIDLTLIPDGVSNIDEDVVKNGDAIYSTSYVARYGYKETTYSDDSLTTLDELMRQGVVQLRKIMAPTISLDVKAVDLALFMEGYEHLQVGQAVRVRSVSHDVDEYLMVSSIDLDLQNPGQTEYVFGASYDSLTGQQSGYLKSLNAGINASLDTVSSLDQTVKDQAVQIGSVEQIANDAKDTAENAQNTANNAQQAAQDAQNSASSALDKAEAAEGAVNEIQGMIDDINSGAEQAKQDAAQAKADAQQAAAKADAAAEKADSYQQQITDVTTTVNGVVQEVDGYSAQIAGAVEDAGAALSAVTSLEADVDGFKTSVSQTYQTKQDAAEQMAQEVLDRNSAIEQSASEITQSVSETYQVKGDYLTEGQAAEVYASKAELSTTADAITATVEEKFDDSLLVKEADGGIIDCGDTAGMPLAGLTVYGQTRQNLWVNPSGTSKGITVTSNDDGSVAVDGTSTGAVSLYAQTYILRPGSTYTVSVDKAVQSSNDASKGCFFLEMHNANDTLLTKYVGFGTTTAVTFAVPDEATFARIGFYCNSGNTVSGTYRVMLNEGSEAQPWCPPGLNSVEDVTVWQAGKNLFVYPFDVTSNGIDISFDQGIATLKGTSNGVIARAHAYIPVLPNTEYSVSCDGLYDIGNGFYIQEIDAGGGVAVSTRWFGGGVGKLYSYTITTSPTTTKIRLGVEVNKPSGTVIDVTAKLQLEFGEVSEWEAGSYPSSTPIDLLGNKVSSLPDGTRDELVVDAGGNVVLRKRTDIFAGTTSTTWSTYDAECKYAALPSNHGIRNPDTEKLMCDAYPVEMYNWGSTNWTDYPSVSVSTNASWYKRVIYCKGNGPEPNSKAFNVLYLRQDETDIPLGTVDLPDLPEQNAHVWIATGTQGLDPDIHATWYGENASALKNFASKAELKVESDQIKATVEETYSTKEEVSAVEDKADAAQNALDSYKNTVSTTYATKSEVTQTANSIKSEVSEEYVSKDDASATYATKTSVSTVEQTVDSLTSTVSSNYTTLNNKFGSYYTKTEVDQKDSSIKTTVSEVQITANSALTKATTVEQTADGLEVRLTQAEKDVDTAQSTANTALNATKPAFQFQGQRTAVTYVLLAKTTTVYTSSAIGGQTHIYGTIGGYSSTTKGGIDITVKYHGSVNVSLDRKDDTYSSTYSDIWVYIGTDNYVYTYLVEKATYVSDSIYLQSLNATHPLTSSTTAPSGTCVWKMSENTPQNAKTATNYLKFDSSGLCVGNMTSSTLGYNTLIKSTGMDIRNGSTVLSSFGASQIDLGKNSSSSTISFCGGKGEISYKSKTAAGSTSNMFTIESDSKMYIGNGTSRVYLNGYTNPQGIMQSSNGLGGGTWTTFKLGNGASVAFGTAKMTFGNTSEASVGQMICTLPRTFNTYAVNATLRNDSVVPDYSGAWEVTIMVRHISSTQFMLQIMRSNYAYIPPGAIYNMDVIVFGFTANDY